MTTHFTKTGESKIVDTCTLPLTGRAVVDLIITELAVFKVRRGQGLELIEIAPGVTVDHLKKNTQASFAVSPNLCEMQQ